LDISLTRDKFNVEKINLLDKNVYKLIGKNEIRKILFIGASDTGKTTLIQEITNFFLKEKKKVFILDSDIGQSHIGPPTTVGFAEVKREFLDFSQLKIEKFYFVGSIAPAGNLLSLLVGIKKMDESIPKYGEKIIIDTTGYIKDNSALYLKIHKIEILRPDFIFLLNKANEVEEIENFIKFFSIPFLKIQIPLNFPTKTMEERSAYRFKKFKEYFSNSRIEKIDIEKLSIKIIGFKEIKNKEEIFLLNLKGAVISLRNSNLEDKALGIILAKKNNYLTIMTNYEKISEIKGIVISNFFINIEEMR